jgi:hypothetical protein
VGSSPRWWCSAVSFGLVGLGAEFEDGLFGDRLFVVNDEPDHRALHHYAGLNFRRAPPRRVTNDTSVF